MTCKQLGGACDKQFQAETFEEIANLAKQHGMEMYANSDSEHLKAIEEMMSLKNNPDAMREFMDKKQEEFNRLPEE